MRLLTDPKRLVAILLSGVAGVVALISMFLPNPVGDGLLRSAQVIIAVALVLGLLNLLAVHLRTIWRRASGWAQSITIVVAAVGVFALELTPPLAGGTIGATAALFSNEIWEYVYQPLIMSVLALLTFFALRATWHALASRPRDALIIVLVAVIFLVAGGPWAALVPGLPESLAWIETYPVTGVARGLLIGIGVGAVVTTVRLLLGFDQPYFDR